MSDGVSRLTIGGVFYIDVDEITEVVEIDVNSTRLMDQNCTQERLSICVSETVFLWFLVDELRELSTRVANLSSMLQKLKRGINKIVFS